MRGLSSLNQSRSRQKGRGLMTIQGRLTNRSDLYNSYNILQQINAKNYYPCAYHVGERITNFCINSNCLLPLCPKCIKIHSQQHEKMGIYGNFATVQQCLSDCQNIQNESIIRLQQILNVCQDMSSLHKQQIILCKQQIHKARTELIDYINNVFRFYQDQTDKIILQSSKQYQQQLLLYHKQIATLMITQKQLAKKSQNPNLKLQFLIDFYSKPDISTLLNNYAAKIQQIKPDYLQLTVNTYELERIKVIIKKYLDFGPWTENIQQKLQNNLSYQRVTMVSKFPQQSHIKQNQLSSQKDTLKQFVRSPIKNLYSTPTHYDLKVQGQGYGYTNKGQIAKTIEQRINKESMLDKFHSPLQNYSLQKSRRNRV